MPVRQTCAALSALRDSRPGWRMVRRGDADSGLSVNPRTVERGGRMWPNGGRGTLVQSAERGQKGDQRDAATGRCHGCRETLCNDGSCAPGGLSLP